MSAIMDEHYVDDLGYEKVFEFDYDPGEPFAQAGIAVYEHFTRYTVAWTDHVVNEWDQEFDTLSKAMAFVATLVWCGEHRWEPTATLGERFNSEALGFFRAVTS